MFYASTDVLPLGFKDWTKEGVVFDASNESPDIFFANWPVKGMYQPDAIDYFSVGGQAYLITANEGDAREYEYEVNGNDELSARTDETSRGRGLGASSN